jgi:CheY-like chemotaxis protein
MTTAPLILVVDDEPGVAALLAELLMDDDYRTAIARNGAEALMLVQEDPPDLVITDLMMPILNGAGLCTALRDDPLTRHIPIIVMSAVADRLAAGSFHADAVLAKPFDLTVLFDTVEALLTPSHDDAADPTTAE